MNFYDVLGVDPDVDESTVRAAFRERARRYHPDVNDHPEAGDQFTVLTRARDVLTDPDERAAYDRLGHEAYVEKRIDGTFPSPEMDPDPGGRRNSEGTGDPTSPRETPADGGSGATGSGATLDPGANASDSTDPADEDAAADADAPDAPDETAAGGDSGATAAGPDDGGPSGSTSVPPTAGATRSSSDATGSTWAKPSGPERLGRDRRTEREQRGHLTVSLRWLWVLAAAGGYATGVAGYLRASEQGVRSLVDALTSGDPMAVLGALLGARYGVPDPATYAWTAWPLDGLLLVAGALALPVAVSAAVAGLRLRTTWRPRWLHAVGSLGPAVAVVLGYATAVYPGAVPLRSVPLLLDLLLLVVAPAAVLSSFLANRLLLAFPLRRREGTEAP